MEYTLNADDTLIVRGKIVRVRANGKIDASEYGLRSAHSFENEPSRSDPTYADTQSGEDEEAAPPSRLTLVPAVLREEDDEDAPTEARTSPPAPMRSTATEVVVETDPNDPEGVEIDSLSKYHNALQVIEADSVKRIERLVWNGVIAVGSIGILASVVVIATGYMAVKDLVPEPIAETTLVEAPDRQFVVIPPALPVRAIVRNANPIILENTIEVLPPAPTPSVEIKEEQPVDVPEIEEAFVIAPAVEPLEELVDNAPEDSYFENYNNDIPSKRIEPIPIDVQEECTRSVCSFRYRDYEAMVATDWEAEGVRIGACEIGPCLTTITGAIVPKSCLESPSRPPECPTLRLLARHE